MQITSRASYANLYLYINQSEIVAMDWQGFKKHYAQQMTSDQENQAVMDLVTNGRVSLIMQRNNRTIEAELFTNAKFYEYITVINGSDVKLLAEFFIKDCSCQF